MLSKLKVSVKFCGNCNPHVNTRNIYKELLRLAESINWLEFVSINSIEMEVLIIISGCPVSCAERPEGDYKCIEVAGELIDWVHCNEKEIPKKVIESLSKEKRNYES